MNLLSPQHRRALVAGAQAGAAAGLAWWVGRRLLGPSPIYAPVAAVAVIGAGYERRVERVAALLSGMGLAVVIAEVGLRLMGQGPLQIGLLTAAAIVAGRFLLKDLLAVSYAGFNAAILVALGGDGWIPDRLLEALVGAATAYTLVYFVFPPRPVAHLRRAVERHVETASSLLREAAEALREGDGRVASEVEQHSGKVDRRAQDLLETFDFSEQVARFSPWRRSERPETAAMRERARRVQAVLRDATAAVRVAGWLVRNSDRPQGHLADSLAHMADAIDGVRQLAVGEQPECDIPELIGRAGERARDGCDRSDPRHVALVVAIEELAESVAAWTDRVTAETG